MQPICLIFSADWLDWQCCLAGSSYGTSRILIFSILIGAEYSAKPYFIVGIDLQIFDHDNFFLNGLGTLGTPSSSGPVAQCCWWHRYWYQQSKEEEALFVVWRQRARPYSMYVYVYYGGTLFLKFLPTSVRKSLFYHVEKQ